MKVIQRADCPPYITKDTSEIREFVNPHLDPRCHNLSLAEATLYPGCTTQAHRHPRSEEIYYFLSGRGLMLMDNEERPVEAGQAVFIPAGAGHECRNTGNVPLTFLCQCAPAYTHEDTDLL